MIDESIIREYDIRGVYNKTLTTESAYLIGWSFAQYIKKYSEFESNMVNVCRDGRLSSPALSSSLIEGLLDGGVNVEDIGVGPTPLLYYSTFVCKVDAGIMVTGSHNPSEYNGFKFIFNRKPFFGDHIKELYDISKEYSSSRISNRGSVKQVSFTDDYVRMLIDSCQIEKEMKIAWDPGNGAAGEVVERLCNNLVGSHYVINEKIDGRFPAHHPDPTVKKNLKQLIDLVYEKKCDFGIAFDGDGDRIGVVDKFGRIIWGDQLLIILAKEILSRNKGAPIIADVKASKVFFDEIRKYGGEPVMWKTGHSNIKQHMKDINCPLAGEMSGHIFIADQYFGYDDALYTAIRLIKLLANSDKSLYEIINALPHMYSTPEIRIECNDSLKFKIIDNISEKMKRARKKFISIDGVRHDFENGWWLLRASNTQPVLVCRIEATSEESINREFAFLQELLSKEGVSLSDNHLVVD
ncbi:MAG: phosphomannomutase/phosphoglucomutase [Alphaproteobacteria bacterium]|nr:phosphomannomutase/phosphoglucomutase [Alphaproteobacteria bacterium]